MGNKLTFDETNEQSISDFAEKLFHLSETEIDKECLTNNLNKAVTALKLMKEDEYKNNRTNQLLRLIGNLVLLKTKEIVNEIISSGLLRIYEKLIKYSLQDGCWDTKILLRVFSALTTLNRGIIIKASIDTNIYDLTLQTLQRENFLKDENIADDPTFNLFDTVISYLSSTSRNQEGKQKLNKIGMFSFILNLLNILNSKISQRNELNYVKLDIIVTLVSLQSESEIEKIQISDDIVETSIRMLGQTINNSKTNKKEFDNSRFYLTYTIDGTTHYYRAVNILRRIIKISTKEAIKEKLFDSNIFEYLIELIAKGNDEEIELTCELTCSMCLNNNIISHLRTNKRVLESINKTFETTKNDATKRYCKQIIHLINPNLDQSNKIKDKAKVNHIMISYNHKYKEICSQINQELNKDGYLTWMDTKEAFNDLYDAMANAIENASILLICYSEEYKESTNCRYEANYAAQLNKPMIFVKMQQNYKPDGWLGLILGSKLYIDCSKGKIDKTCINELLKQIDSILFDLKKPILVERTPSHTQIQSIPRSDSNKSNNNVESWNRDDTQAWFVQHDLENISKLFPKCTGKTLKALWELKQKDYQEFNNSIDKQIDKSNVDVDMQEKMDFYESLQKLF